jgi:hypothetical protein
MSNNINLHIEDDSDASEKNIHFKKPEIIEYDDQQVYVLDKRFQRLHRDSVYLLDKSQIYHKVSMALKIIIIIFSLTTSYVSAISGIDETTKTYIITAFSLTCAIISGITSIKNFSNEASKLYTGYTEYQLKCSMIEQIFYHFKSTIPYDELIISIDKLITQYEKEIDKTQKEKKANAEKRIIYLQEVWRQRIQQKNNGIIPEWLRDKKKLENNSEEYIIESSQNSQDNKEEDNKNIKEKK